MVPKEAPLKSQDQMHDLSSESQQSQQSQQRSHSRGRPGTGGRAIYYFQWAFQFEMVNLIWSRGGGQRVGNGNLELQLASLDHALCHASEAEGDSQQGCGDYLPGVWARGVQAWLEFGASACPSTPS